MKSAFPNSTQYTYFRAGDHGFEDCIEIPASAVYLTYREKERSMELLVTATQCNVNLPQAFIGRIAHAIKRAEQEAARGHLRWIEHIAPNVDPNIVQNVYKAIGVPKAQRELSMTLPKPRPERLKQRPSQGVVQSLWAKTTSAKDCANECPKLFKFFLICSSWSCQGQACTQADANSGEIISAISYR